VVIIIIITAATLGLCMRNPCHHIYDLMPGHRAKTTCVGWRKSVTCRNDGCAAWSRRLKSYRDNALVRKNNLRRKKSWTSITHNSRKGLAL
jgi:hypothetical protein